MNRVTSLLVVLAATAATLTAPAPLSATTAARADREPRAISARLHQDNRHAVSLRGWVERWPDGRVVIQKRRCLRDRCAWRYHTSTRTGPRQRFWVRVHAPEDGRLYWRAAVRRKGGFSWSAKRARGWTYQIG